MPTPSNAFPDPTTAAVTSAVTDDESPADAPAELSAEAIESSTPFVGRWNELVSTTNWEKGRVISEWRDALEKSGAQVTEYSDEAWARLVGGVTSQHVGRLRRVHERFGSAAEQYPGLYWSHFQAGLDWQDAEMWLEGAISNGWSVSQMRASRWEAVGGPEGPTEGQVIETQLDDDGYSALVDRDEDAAEPVAKPAAEASADPDATERAAADDDSEAPFDVPGETVEAAPRVQPFKDLGQLPDDVADAFEQFKLVILSHKLSGWDAISRDDLLGALDSLKALAVAPSSDD